jgi:hypothetical protein
MKTLGLFLPAIICYLIGGIPGSIAFHFIANRINLPIFKKFRFKSFKISLIVGMAMSLICVLLASFVFSFNLFNKENFKEIILFAALGGLFPMTVILIADKFLRRSFTQKSPNQLILNIIRSCKYFLSIIPLKNKRINNTIVFLPSEKIDILKCIENGTSGRKLMEIQVRLGIKNMSKLVANLHDLLQDNLLLYNNSYFVTYKGRQYSK